MLKKIIFYRVYCNTIVDRTMDRVDLDHWSLFSVAVPGIDSKSALVFRVMKSLICCAFSETGCVLHHGGREGQRAALLWVNMNVLSNYSFISLPRSRYVRSWMLNRSPTGQSAHTPGPNHFFWNVWILNIFLHTLLIFTSYQTWLKKLSQPIK